MSAASNTGNYSAIPIAAGRQRGRHWVQPPYCEPVPELDRDALVQQQILGVLRQGSPPPDVSWRAVWRRMLFFVLAMALLMLGGSLFGGA